MPEGVSAEEMFGCVYTFLPMFHAGGKQGLYAAALLNVRMVMRERFSVTNYWDDVRAFNVKTVGGFGSMIMMLLAQPPRPDDAENPARAVSMSPIIPQVHEFMERFGIDSVGTAYGMTEIGAPIRCTNPPDMQTSGQVQPGFQCKVVDEHGQEVPPGTVGELVVRADEAGMLCAGYFNMPEKTAESWRDGWWHTGDAFMVDENRWFYFKDRIKDAIRRRGENISSFEVEEYVNSHSAVLESAAVAVESELLEDEVKVVVQLKPGQTLTPEELLEYLSPRMPRFMVPRYVEFVEDLPRTPTAKVRKVELRENPLNSATWDRVEAGIDVPKK